MLPEVIVDVTVSEYIESQRRERENKMCVLVIVTVPVLLVMILFLISSFGASERIRFCEYALSWLT